MERDPVPVDPEGDPGAEAEFLRPDDVPPEVAEGWERDDPAAGQAPTG
ncbi:MAG TPA: hypothetical protein VM938_02020 [Acidimicrobiales bacterium]|nr:hypothetical protein [Acidimicrobiales bacterium]